MRAHDSATLWAVLRNIASFALVAVLASPSLAQQEAAATPSPAPTPLDGQMIIWSGGKTQAEAEKQLAEFKHYAQALKSFIAINGEVVESATVQGLKPGFFVVAAGVCNDKDVDFPLGILQAIEPSVYAKPVHYKAEDVSAAPDCPAPVQVAEEGDNSPVYWKPGDAVRTVTRSGTLVALPFSYDWSEQGDFAREYFEVKIELLLVNPGRILLDSQLYDGPSDAAKLKSAKVSGQSIAWDVEYADPPCDPSGDRFVSWARSFWATAEGAHIRIGNNAAQRLKSGRCGYAEESDAIQGKHRN